MEDSQELLEVQDLYDQEAPQQEAPPVKKPNIFRRGLNGWKKWSRKKKIWSVIALVLVVVILSRLLSGGGKPADSGPTYLTAAVERGSIVATLSDSGTLEPADS